MKNLIMKLLKFVGFLGAFAILAYGNYKIFGFQETPFGVVAFVFTMAGLWGFIKTLKPLFQTEYEEVGFFVPLAGGVAVILCVWGVLYSTEVVLNGINLKDISKILFCIIGGLEIWHMLYSILCSIWWKKWRVSVLIFVGAMIIWLSVLYGIYFYFAWQYNCDALIGSEYDLCMTKYYASIGLVGLAISKPFNVLTILALLSSIPSVAMLEKSLKVWQPQFLKIKIQARIAYLKAL